MPKINVTRATIKDVQKIGNIAYQVAQIHYQQTQSEFKKATRQRQIEYIQKSILDNDLLVLKAEIGETIVGYAVVYFNTYPVAYFRFNKRAFIGSIGVDTDYQRQGVGKALLKAVEKEVKKRHISVIEIDYYTFNTAAESLYKHCGYTEKKRYMSKVIR